LMISIKASTASSRWPPAASAKKRSMP